jgi:hypothetical protein
MFQEQRQLTKLRQEIQALSAAMVGMAKEMVKGDIEKGADEFGKALSSTGNSAHSAPIVFISGATGGNAWNVNGLFEPSEEKSSDGGVVYKKRGDASSIIEHINCKWQIKHAKDKGKDNCWAQVGGYCELQACKWNVWRVAKSGALHDQENVKMWTGAEAEAQASSLDARARQHTAPTPLPLV